MVTSVSSASVSSLIPPTSARAARRNAPIAPGTVGMQFSTSYRRRSRLKPITYSMCCQSGDQAPAVADLDVAGHRADGRVGERLHQHPDRVGFQDGVAVDGDDQVVPGQRDAGVEGVRLAAVGHPDHPHVRQAEALGQRPRCRRWSRRRRPPPRCPGGRRRPATVPPPRCLPSRCRPARSPTPVRSPADPSVQDGLRRCRACRVARISSNAVRATVSSPTSTNSPAISVDQAVGQPHGPEQRAAPPLVGRARPGRSRRAARVRPAPRVVFSSRAATASARRARRSGPR